MYRVESLNLRQEQYGIIYEDGLVNLQNLITMRELKL